MTIDEAIKQTKSVIFLTKESGFPIFQNNSEYWELVLDCLRDRKESDKKHLPVWAVELWTGENNSGWALAGTRNTLSQDFICAELWYETYGMEWIAYDHPTQVIRYD